MALAVAFGCQSESKHDNGEDNDPLFLTRKNETLTHPAKIFKGIQFELG